MFLKSTSGYFQWTLEVDGIGFMCNFTSEKMAFLFLDTGILLTVLLQLSSHDYGHLGFTNRTNLLRERLS